MESISRRLALYAAACQLRSAA